MIVRKSIVFLVIALGMAVSPIPANDEGTPPPAAKKFPSLPPYLLSSTHRVRATTTTNKKYSVSYGSAFVVDLAEFGVAEHKYLMTAAHVVQNVETREMSTLIEIEVTSPKHSWMIAHVIESDLKRDLCLLRVGEDMEWAVGLAAADSVQVGDALVAVGCPGGSAVSPSFGYLVAKYQDVMDSTDPNNWQSSTAIFNGNSGGPVFDPNAGKVVGVIVQDILETGRGVAPNASMFVSPVVVRDFLVWITNRIKRKS